MILRVIPSHDGFLLWSPVAGDRRYWHRFAGCYPLSGKGVEARDAAGGGDCDAGISDAAKCQDTEAADFAIGAAAEDAAMEQIFIF